MPAQASGDCPATGKPARRAGLPIKPSRFVVCQDDECQISGKYLFMQTSHCFHANTLTWLPLPSRTEYVPLIGIRAPKEISS